MRSTLPVEANQDSDELGILVERALKQTAERGGTYAVVPYPWAECWFRITQVTEVVAFDWWSYCGPNKGWDFAEASFDGEGNYLVCLLEKDHEGNCGFEWLL